MPGARDVDRLPSASTCYNTLKLPNCELCLFCCNTVDTIICGSCSSMHAQQWLSL